LLILFPFISINKLLLSLCFVSFSDSLLREELMSGDFASNMKLLQNFPETIDLNEIINKAKLIRIT
jgi:hypothetical protein